MGPHLFLPFFSKIHLHLPPTSNLLSRCQPSFYRRKINRSSLYQTWNQHHHSHSTPPPFFTDHTTRFWSSTMSHAPPKKTHLYIPLFLCLKPNTKPIEYHYQKTPWKKPPDNQHIWVSRLPFDRSHAHGHHLKYPPVGHFFLRRKTHTKNPPSEIAIQSLRKPQKKKRIWKPTW